jgi:hypothetical protein
MGPLFPALLHDIVMEPGTDHMGIFTTVVSQACLFITVAWVCFPEMLVISPDQHTTGHDRDRGRGCH